MSESENSGVCRLLMFVAVFFFIFLISIFTFFVFVSVVWFSRCNAFSYFNLLFYWLLRWMVRSSRGESDGRLCRF